MGANTMMLLNVLLCSGVIYIGVCRLAKMDCGVQLRIHLAYNAMVVSAAASGLQYWLWGTRPQWDSIGFAAAILMFMGLGVRRWRNGVPKEFITEFGKPE